MSIGRRVTYVFEQVSLSGSKTGVCPTCGKKATRKTTVTHTINPYNKNSDGNPKGRLEVMTDVRAELDRWKGTKGEPVYHARCEP